MQLLNSVRHHWPERDGQRWLSVRLGYWLEFGRWPRLGSVFTWNGYLPRLWYFIQCAIWWRYNNLYIPTLPPTWCDNPDAILHAAFTVFARYINSDGRWSVESLKKEIASSTDQDVVTWCQSALPTAEEEEALYQWWTIDRHRERQEEADALMAWHGAFTSDTRREPRTQALFDITNQLEQRNDDTEQEMLHRLINIRRSLWT